MPVDLIQLALAMGVSFIILAGIIFCANSISRYGRKHAKDRAASLQWPFEDYTTALRHFILLRVLLDKNDHASLSAFQFLCWTLLLSFLYSTLWFLELLTGSTRAPPPIEPSLIPLMGISIAIPIASQGIAAYKRVKPRDEGSTYTEPDYASMLEENGKPSLLRLQMFLWTLAALVIYTGLFLAPVFSATPPDTLVLPPIDQTLLFLMGLSATGYLGNQAYSGKVEKSEEAPPLQPIKPATTTVPGTLAVRLTPTIREIVPRDVEPMGIVSLLGSGFGTQQDTIIIDENRVSPSSIRRWEETRIEFSLPKTVSYGSHNIRVISGGETANGQISVVGDPQRIRGVIEVDADIIRDIWIDDPYQQGYKVPPVGYFIPDKRYHFFFEFDVPPGTPSWGRIQFRAGFFIDGVSIATGSFMPGAMNGRNIGNFNHAFPTEGKHHIEIRGINSKSMDIEVRKPPGQQ